MRGTVSCKNYKQPILHSLPKCTAQLPWIYSSFTQNHWEPSSRQGLQEDYRLVKFKLLWKKDHVQKHCTTHIHTRFCQDKISLFYVVFNFYFCAKVKKHLLYILWKKDDASELPHVFLFHFIAPIKPPKCFVLFYSPHHVLLLFRIMSWQRKYRVMTLFAVFIYCVINIQAKER